MAIPDSGVRPTSGFTHRMGQVDKLVEAIEELPDPSIRDQVSDLIRAVLDLHADGLDRVFRGIAQIGPAGLDLINTLAADEVINGLLLLHGLHPASLDARVQTALDGLTPVLQTRGGSVELISLEDGVLQLRMLTGGDSRSSSIAALKNAIEEAVLEKAPDLVSLQIETPTAHHDGFVPVEQVKIRRSNPASGGIGIQGVDQSSPQSR